MAYIAVSEMLADHLALPLLETLEEAAREKRWT